MISTALILVGSPSSFRERGELIDYLRRIVQVMSMSVRRVRGACVVVLKEGALTLKQALLMSEWPRYVLTRASSGVSASGRLCEDSPTGTRGVYEL